MDPGGFALSGFSLKLHKYKAILCNVTLPVHKVTWKGKNSAYQISTVGVQNGKTKGSREIKTYVSSGTKTEMPMDAEESYLKQFYGIKLYFH